MFHPSTFIFFAKSFWMDPHCHESSYQNDENPTITNLQWEGAERKFRRNDENDYGEELQTNCFLWMVSDSTFSMPCLVIIYMFSTTKLLAVTAIIGKTGHHTEDEDIVDNEHARKGQSRLSDSTYCSFHLLLVGEHLQSRFISFIGGGGGGCAIRTIQSSIDPPALSWLMIQSR